MPKTIYIVTHGDYSDYSVDGTFSSKEKAQEYINKIGSDRISWCRIEDFNIEEWILDEEVGKIKRVCWCAKVDLRHPLTEEVKIETRGPNEVWEKPRVRSKDTSDTYVDGVYEMTSYVSPEHAHKLVVELIQRITAENAIRRGDI